MVTSGPFNSSAFLLRNRDRSFRANIDAGTAAFAVDIADDEIGEKILRFGIGTPEALQRATLHEDGRPYTRPVVDAEPLDIKNEPSAVLSSNRHGSLWSILANFNTSGGGLFIGTATPPPAFQVIFC